ncbi:MAG: hypothetical protein IPH85_05190 [Ignavibacteria bacterium]|nr:hypothetical protein [Ignavibacteria bacterium]MBP6509084.1 hypothetical protein [Candidatus Kapabacteria bacterium]MBK7034037.1 hypothetical protein [Ignavibacteria bacterium]MBK7185314.1 hypothetical protein [Ignavibacteria bacterium]MBK9182523.1 hypothetical protein [Ignavibacteria bacterium]
MRNILTIAITLLCAIMSLQAQQLGDLSGRNLILNDGGVAGGTKNTVLIAPQDAATQLVSYTVLLPAVAAPAVNAVLQVSAVAGTTATLSWTVAPSLSNASVFEEETAASLNIRRRTPFISGVQGVPGLGAFDAQGRRALAAQTATGQYSGILSGSNNTASGNYSLSLGGLTNTSTADYSTIVNGTANTVSGASSFVLVGSTNSVTGAGSGVIAGTTNTVGGDASLVLTGNSHSVVGANSVVLGGRSLTVNSGNTMIWSGTLTAFSVTAGNSAFFHNADVLLTNANSTASRLIFLEPNATATYPAVGANFAAFRAGVMAADNVYTLPTAVGTVGQVLKITAVAGTDATLEWQSDGGATGVQDVNVNADNQVVVVAAGTTYLRLTSNGAPGARTVTFTPAVGVLNGQVLVVRTIAVAPGNGVEFIDGGGAPDEFQLSGNFLPQNNDTITFVWDAGTTTWLEVARRNN